LLAILVAVLPVVNNSIIRRLVAGSFLLFVPGYLFVVVLFPREDQLSLLERGVFSVGASLGLGGLLAIPVSQTAWGVQLWTLTLTYELTIAVLATAVVARRRRIASEDRAEPIVAAWDEVVRLWGRRNEIGGGNRYVQTMIGVAVVVAVLATAYTVATPLPSGRYTELYLLGPNGTISGVPGNVSDDGTVEVKIGVTNNEFTKQRYGLQFQMTAGGGSAAVVRTETFSLSHNATWKRNRVLSPPEGVSEVTLNILLFRGPPPGEPVDPREAYRQVQLVLTTGDDEIGHREDAHAQVSVRDRPRGIEISGTGKY